MKKVAVMIEPWKLPIFDRELKAAGYSYTDLGEHNGVQMLRVEVADEKVPSLAQTILQAQAICRKEKHRAA